MHRRYPKAQQAGQRDDNLEQQTSGEAVDQRHGGVQKRGNFIVLLLADVVGRALELIAQLTSADSVTVQQISLKRHEAHLGEGIEERDGASHRFLLFLRVHPLARLCDGQHAPSFFDKLLDGDDKLLVHDGAAGLQQSVCQACQCLGFVRSVLQNRAFRRRERLDQLRTRV